MRALPLVAEQVADGGLPLRSAKLIDTRWARSARFLDRPDGLLDGQPQEQVLQAVIMRGVPDLVGEAIGGVASALARLIDALLPVRLQERSDRAHADLSVGATRTDPAGS